MLFFSVKHWSPTISAVNVEKNETDPFADNYTGLQGLHRPIIRLNSIGRQAILAKVLCKPVCINSDFHDAFESLYDLTLRVTSILRVQIWSS